MYVCMYVHNLRWSQQLPSSVNAFDASAEPSSPVCVYVCMHICIIHMHVCVNAFDASAEPSSQSVCMYACMYVCIQSKVVTAAAQVSERF